MAIKISYIIVFLTGLGMLFIGGRFLISPQLAEAAYGIRLQTGNDFSFHYIKGVRDLFSGLLVCALVLLNQRKALGVALLTAAIIPFGDMLIVMSKDYNSLPQAIPHIIAVIICIVAGLVLLLAKPVQKAVTVSKGFINVIQTAKNGGDTIIELNILPGNKTPWHYHTLFTESFEILKGRLEIGKGKEIHHVKQGDTLTIKPYEKHYYNNVYKEECIIRTIIKPGNTDFENALLILKGMEADGLATKAGTPKKLSDLALFVRLNDSRMIGFQKIAEPFFNYLSERAIKKGYLDTLMQQYESK